MLFPPWLSYLQAKKIALGKVEEGKSSPLGPEVAGDGEQVGITKQLYIYVRLD